MWGGGGGKKETLDYSCRSKMNRFKSAASYYQYTLFLCLILLFIVVMCILAYTPFILGVDLVKPSAPYVNVHIANLQTNRKTKQSSKRDTETSLDVTAALEERTQVFPSPRLSQTVVWVIALLLASGLMRQCF